MLNNDKGRLKSLTFNQYESDILNNETNNRRDSKNVNVNNVINNYKNYRNRVNRKYYFGVSLSK